MKSIDALYNKFDFEAIVRIVKPLGHLCFLSGRPERNFIRRFCTLFLVLFTATMPLWTQTVHDISSSPLFIPGNASQDFVVTGTTKKNFLTIGTGYKGTVTLRNLNIKSSRMSNNFGISGISCITVEGEYNRSNLDPVTKVNFVLDGRNELTFTGENYCALQVNQGAQIHITAIDPNDNSSGELIALNTAASGGHGGGGAGIGAPNFPRDPKSSPGQGTSEITQTGQAVPDRKNTAGGNIIIGSGTIKAKGGHGAGIGGGWWTYYNGYVIVYGGNVDASSQYHSAGIGSGCPQGTGVIECYADKSSIIALPPAVITAFGTEDSGEAISELGLNGAKNITYINDQNKTEITVRTVDNEPNANIYLDLTATSDLTDIFSKLGINYDLKKVKIGKTNASGELKFNAQFEQKTTFFTDASSSSPASLGRPYMPVVTTVIGNKGDKKTIKLPLLSTNISFTDYPSTPLELGYTQSQARDNAHTIKLEYHDAAPMTNVSFIIQGGDLHFSSLIFLSSDKTTVVKQPETLKAGDVYYIIMPIKPGKPIGIYSDVLLINAKWDDIPLPGYIRRVGEQRVVFNDTGKNKYIKVTASPNKFLASQSAGKSVELSLNIDHTGLDVLYDPSDVTAKYLISKSADYNDASAAASAAEWIDLNVPSLNKKDSKTIASFADIESGTYYIHWRVRSGVVYAHSQTVQVPPSLYGGFGPYTIVDKLKAGSLRGNPAVCKDDTPSEIKGDVSTGGSGDYTYQWQTSTDGSTWTDIGVNTVNYTPKPLSVSPTYYRRITVDNQVGESYPSDNVFKISTIDNEAVAYWNRKAADRNWNNPDNWVDASGSPLGIVPVSCSGVVIPEGAANYPSLDTADTPVDVYGSPKCRDITFDCGTELAFQHKLIYDKAFVRYNWGYYDDTSSANHGKQPEGNASGVGASQNKRGKWQTLAVPLKSVATGDFGFAGYPMTWQAGFALADPKTAFVPKSIEVGNFDRTYSLNDMPLSETNNAIAVKVALLDNRVGYSDHRNLEGLKGRVVIPYFENLSQAEFYTAHEYNSLTGESKFFYFNQQTLQLLNSPVGKMQRGSEAYRFVYETGNTAPNISVPAGNPSDVPGYKQVVKTQNSISRKVMIGNPFVSKINSKRLFEANATKLNESAGYQLFNNDNDTWEHHIPSYDKYIPPFQAFIVTLIDEMAELSYPLEGTLALTAKSDGLRSMTADAGDAGLYLKSADDNGLGGDRSVLASPATGKCAENVRKMIHPEGHNTPETFFIAPDTKEYNLIQLYNGVTEEIGIGVKCSNTERVLSIAFENIDGFFDVNNLKPVLLDKYLGKIADLRSGDSYYFKQRDVGLDENYVDADRFALRLVSSTTTLSDETVANIRITYADKTLDVAATNGISRVEVYDMYGKIACSKRNINKTNYRETLSLHLGVYVVKVYTDDGKVKLEKIVEK